MQPVKIVLHPPARPLPEFFGEDGMIAAVHPVGAEAGFERRHLSVERGERDKVAVGTLPELGFRNRHDDIESRACKGQSAGDRRLVSCAARQLRRYVTGVERDLRRREDVLDAQVLVHEVQPELHLGRVVAPLSKQFGNGRRVKIVVGVEEENDRPTTCRKAGVESSCVTAIFLPQAGLDPPAVGRDHLRRPVGRRIVYDDDFDLRVVLVEGTVDRAAQEPRIIVIRNDDGDRKMVSDGMHRSEPRFSALVAANLLMQVLEGDARPESTASRAAVKTTAQLRRGGRRKSCSIMREPPQFCGI